MIYLDHDATMPILAEVLEAMMPYLTTEWGNPSKSVILSAVEDLAPSRSRLSRHGLRALGSCRTGPQTSA